MRKTIMKRLSIFLTMVMMVSLFSNIDWTVKAVGNSITVADYIVNGEGISECTISGGNLQYDSIVVPDGYYLTIAGANVSVNTVTLGAGSHLNVFNAGENDAQIGTISIDRFTPENGAEIFIAGKENLPIIGDTPLIVYDGNTELNSDANFEWGGNTFVYAIGEGNEGNWILVGGFDGIEIDNRGAGVQYKLDNGPLNPLTAEEGSDRLYIDKTTYQGARDITFKFTGNNNNSIYGIRVDYHDDENDKQVSMTKRLNEIGEYTLPAGPAYYIEAINWDMLFDNEYAIRTIGFPAEDVVINSGDGTLPVGETRTFDKGKAISFTVKNTEGNEQMLQLHSVVASYYESGERPFNYDQQTGVYSYTPETDESFEIKLYLNQEWYNFENLQPGERQYAVEYQVRHENENDNCSVSVTSPTLNAGASISADDRTKLILDESVSSVTFTITTGEGYACEVYVDGQYMQNAIVEDEYTWNVAPDSDNKSPEFYFRNKNNQDPGTNPGGGGQPGNNQYSIRVFGLDDRSTTVNINGENKSFNENIDFEVNNEIKLTVSENVYKVCAVVNSEQGASEVNFAWNEPNRTYFYTPTSEAGFEIKIYANEEWYYYENFEIPEGKYPVEYQVRHDDADDNCSVRVTSPSLNEGDYISADDLTKLALDGSVRFVTFDITTGEGYDCEVYVDGQYMQNAIVDGVYTWNVAPDSDNRSPEFYFRNQNDPGPGPGGDDPGPGPSDFDYDHPNQEIVKHEYAYYVGNKAEGNQKEEFRKFLATEIWFEYFNSGRPANGKYGIESYGLKTESSNLIEQTLEEDSNHANSIYTKLTLGDKSAEADQATGLYYYPYTLDLTGTTESGQEIQDAVGKAYILNSDAEFVVKTGERYHVVEVEVYQDDNNNPIAKDVSVKGSGDVVVFGNGTCTIGSLETGSDNSKAWHVSQEHSGLDGIIGNVGCRLIVCADNFEGVLIKADKDAAAWNFENTGIYETGANAEEAAVAEIYYGSNSVTLDAIAFDNINTSDVVRSISVDTSKLSQDAVAITETNGTFKIDFKTGYDSIPLKVEFADGTVRYVDIHRVGLNISDSDVQNGAFDAWHGTDHTVKYNIVDAGNDQKAIYATFYYTDVNARPSTSVSLFTTVTTRSGVERKVISDPITMSGTISGGVLGQASQGTDKFYDDFLIWSGTNEEFANLQKVEAIVYNEGSGDSFGGVKVGSGTGVVWTK